MMQRLYKCKLWSALILLAGTASLSASERVSAEVLAIKKTLPSVGNIHTEKAAPQGNNVFKAENGRKVNGMGAGIIIDERGYMVTNHHVVADVDTIRVDIEDENRMKASYTARRIAADKEHDLAIIKIDAGPHKPFKVMPCGTSSDLMVGEKVIAIGNPFGYDGTITLGIISQIGRDVEANETVSYKNLIQTDAAINPGNSGGPLINIDGEVIGINVAIRANSQKIGFAIPIDDARAIIAKMMSIESMDRNFHGLITKDIKDGTIRMLVVDGSHSNSPAALAGFLNGDVITKAGSVDIVDAVDLERALLHRRAGDSVDLTIKRNGEVKKTSLSLAQFSGGRATLADVQVTSRANNDDADGFWNQLGMRLVPLPQNEHKSHLSKTKYRGGMRVLDVRNDSPAAAAMIQKGDILVGLQDWETTNVDNIKWILHRLTMNPATPEIQNNQVKFYIVRSQETKYGTMALTNFPGPRTASNGN